MAQQNIYDNETFFEGYRKLRDNEVNANNLFEIPALFSLMPDLTNKKVLKALFDKRRFSWEMKNGLCRHISLPEQGL